MALRFAKRKADQCGARDLAGPWVGPCAAMAATHGRQWPPPTAEGNEAPGVERQSALGTGIEVHIVSLKYALAILVADEAIFGTGARGRGSRWSGRERRAGLLWRRHHRRRHAALGPDWRLGPQWSAHNARLVLRDLWFASTRRCGDIAALMVRLLRRAKKNGLALPEPTR